MPSSPLLWFGNSAKFLKSLLVIPGSTSGQIQLQPAAVTSTHTLTLPASQGVAATVLTNDGSGGLSWSPTGATPTSTFTLVNNQATFADVTGFLVSPVTYKSFTSEFLVERNYPPVIVDAVDTDYSTNVGTPFANVAYKSKQMSSGAIVYGADNTSSTNNLYKVSAAGFVDFNFQTNLGTGLNGAIGESALAIQSDDSVVFGGGFTSVNGTSTGGLARVSSTGVLDTTFNTNLGTGFNATVNAIAVQADQKIIVGGNFTTLNGTTRNRLVRLNANGTVDTSFYTNLGTAFTNNEVNAVYVLANQQILVGGNFTTFNGNTRNYIVRLNANGTEDATFYTNVGAITGTNVRGFAEDSTNNIYFCGLFTSVGGNGTRGVCKLSSAGIKDAAYNTALGGGFNNQVYCLAVQSSGKLIVGGGFTAAFGTTTPYLARRLTTGAADTAFATSLGTSFDNTVYGVTTLSTDQLSVVGLFTTLNSVSYSHYLKYEMITSQDFITQGTLKGVFHTYTGKWLIAIPSSVGDYTGVSFNMTDAGQLQYTTTNLTGTAITSTMKFQVTGI